MPFQLNLRPPDEPAVADGPVRLMVLLRNVGQSASEVVKPLATSPFTFRVFTADGSRLLAAGSRADKWDSQPGAGLLPTRFFPTMSLDPGGAALYRDDLTDVMEQPLEPGQYLVEASYRDGGDAATSERIPVEIVVSKPVALAQTFDGYRRRLVLVEFHDRQDGSILIRKRESGATLLDPFHDLHTFRPSVSVRQTSVGLEAGYGIPVNWRWAAWLDGSALHACVLRRDGVLYQRGPLEVRLESPSLLPYGYLHQDGGGTFVVAGLENGRSRVRIVGIPAGNDVSPRFTDVQLANLPGAVPYATMVCRPDGPGEMILSWVLDAPGSSIVVQYAIDPATGAVTRGPVEVFATARRIVAAYMCPVLNPGQSGAFQALLAPAAEGGPHTIVAVQTPGGATREEFDLPSLEVLEGKPVKRWILPSSRFSSDRILAATEHEIWAAGSGNWRRIGEGDLMLSSVALWAFGADAAACSWFDTVRGYRSVSL